MRPPFQKVLFAVLCLACQACSDQVSQKTPPLDLSERLPGGNTTVNPLVPSFIEPAANLNRVRQQDFFVGLSFFRDPWVAAPSSTTDRDGLGPLFNARSCVACHPRGGRGHPPTSPEEPMLSMVLRLSLPGKSKQFGVVPEPTYGDQLQIRGTSMENNFGLASPNSKGVVGEARAQVIYEEIHGNYADGEPWILYKPNYQITDASLGALHPSTIISPRIAPPLTGVGLIEAIAEAEIMRHADPEDRNRDGISGRPNFVWDNEAKTLVLGRFGLKANQPNLRQQTAAAFRNDLGITNDLFPDQPCSDRQQQCLESPSGIDPRYGVEINQNLLNATTFFIRLLGVPKRRNWQTEQIVKGRELFYQANCHLCHIPSFTTAQSALEPELANQTIWPYTDLLLHDMGEPLADGRTDFEANGREWRTSPLWGIGSSDKVSGPSHYLHDGRARSISEAILWHGGEAQSARDRYNRMKKAERSALVAFIQSL